MIKKRNKYMILTEKMDSKVNHHPKDKVKEAPDFISHQEVLGIVHIYYYHINRPTNANDIFAQFFGGQNPFDMMDDSFGAQGFSQRMGGNSIIFIA